MREPDYEADEERKKHVGAHSSASPLSKPLFGLTFARSLTPNCKMTDTRTVWKECYALLGKTVMYNYSLSTPYLQVPGAKGP